MQRDLFESLQDTSQIEQKQGQGGNEQMDTLQDATEWTQIDITDS